MAAKVLSIHALGEQQISCCPMNSNYSDETVTQSPKPESFSVILWLGKSLLVLLAGAGACLVLKQLAIALLCYLMRDVH